MILIILVMTMMVVMMVVIGDTHYNIEQSICIHGSQTFQQSSNVIRQSATAFEPIYICKNCKTQMNCASNVFATKARKTRQKHACIKVMHYAYFLLRSV